MKEVNEKDIENVLKILDEFGRSDVSRLKINISDEEHSESVQKEYHHGRCDIGSPWAKGDSFDVLE